MGVKGLYSYLRPYRRVLGTSRLQGPEVKRIGFDAMSILYKYKSDFKAVYPLLSSLQAAGNKLLFVFDGKPPVAKEAEVKERRDARAGAMAQAEVLKEQLKTAELGERERQIIESSVARLEFQGWHMSREVRHEFQRQLWDLGIPYVKGLGEADTALVDMVAAGKLDVVVSTDMDYLLSNVPRLWIPYRGAGGADDSFEEIVTEEVLKGEGVTVDGLRDAGILCGVEPLRGKVHVHTHTAFTWIRYSKSLEALLASGVKERQLDALRAAGVLESVRAHFAPQTPWTNRVRPDHYERFKDFLEAL